MIEEWNASWLQCKLTVQRVDKLLFLFLFFLFFSIRTSILAFFVFALLILLLFFILLLLFILLLFFIFSFLSCCTFFVLFVATKLSCLFRFFLFLFLFLFFLFLYCIVVYFFEICFVRCNLVLITLWLTLVKWISIVRPLAPDITVAVV